MRADIGAHLASSRRADAQTFQMIEHRTDIADVDLEAVHAVRHAIGQRADVADDGYQALLPRFGKRDAIGFRPDRQVERNVRIGDPSQVGRGIAAMIRDVGPVPAVHHLRVMRLGIAEDMEMKQLGIGLLDQTHDRVRPFGAKEVADDRYDQRCIVLVFMRRSRRCRRDLRHRHAEDRAPALGQLGVDFQRQFLKDGLPNRNTSIERITSIMNARRVSWAPAGSPSDMRRQISQALIHFSPISQ